ncbi:MAG: methionine synthase [Treponema sp.]|jgi:5-methyltetrahydrofolate--homocysteine methyltransferase|nr:methionine synthase [Treponema sp.]
MTTREQLNAIAGRRILVLDGAMGSMIQSFHLDEEDFRGGRFAVHHKPLLGCNDILCLTMPDVISSIHEAYLEAGADIIETCSFNATAVSLADYGIGDLAYEISAASADLARRAVEKFSGPDKPRFVAGSIGSTVKSASLSPDLNDPAKRGIYWDELEAAYYEHVRGLLDGGVDLLLVETVYDTLNAKAALFAIRRLLEERKADVPIMISATVSGDSGRLLSGQTLEAFCVSVLHARPWAVGLNCSFGAEKLLPHVRTVADEAAKASCLVSAYPNAGLPNQLGGYDETPQTMAASVERYLKEGLVNIIGGCCGSTPAHITAIAAKAASYKPRPAVPAKALPLCRLAGLEPLLIGRQSPQDGTDGLNSLTLIGERTNVAGSRKFLTLISGKKYNEALAFARDTIKAGASLINIGMDDAMLDAEQAMADFLDLALLDPDIARVPFMIDSSRWNVIEAGLKRVQGKSLVNSINLKDGEKEFLRRAGLIRRYGAAAVVMLIDERGQAVNYERKIEIAGRAYGLLIATGFSAENIVFDPNILAIATGISEHDSYALDFIRACSWIRDKCPGVRISGGVSNLSFSFRGNNVVREAMHSVFLYHAARSGLSMAIVNPAALVSYNEIDEELRNAVEDVILNRRPGAAETLLSIAERIAADGSPGGTGRRAASQEGDSDWSGLDAEGRIIHAMVKGLDDHIEADLPELLKKYSPLALVEGPLMEGMKEVGRRFGEGTMYLPQVIRSARVMKKAVAVLEPYMNALPENSALSAGAGVSSPSQKILLATVKGDVHDIGKNIVGLVLGCNGYEIIDLGVMVPAERIFEAAEKENAAVIGLSGLISPSLDEMVYVAREMEKRKMNIPLLIGGAAASLVHTALRIAPEYSGPVVYVPDVGKSAETVRALLSAVEQPRFLAELADSYRKAAARHEAIRSRRTALSPEEARANKIPPASYTPVKPKKTGIIELNGYPLDRVLPYIDWSSFLGGWEIQNERGMESEKLLDDAKTLLKRIKNEKILTLKGVVGIFPAAGDDEDIVVFSPGADNAYNTEIARFNFLRSGEEKPAGVFNPCLADFLKPLDKTGGPEDWFGLFALSAGFGLRGKVLEYQTRGDDYSAILLSSLANALTEAFVEEVHLRVRREWWGYAAGENHTVEEILQGKYTGIRPAFGYPSCPDHEDKRVAFALLEAQKRCGLELTASAMMIPPASVCGMFFASPASCYFSVGAQGDVQLNDWAKRKDISTDEARRRTAI